jgi:chemotaxis protein CheZ
MSNPRIDDEVLTELKVIADFIAKARREIAALRPADLRNERIPSAGAELDAIIKDTEAATHQIMTACEEILAEEPADLESYRGMVRARAMSVLEACSFQDITGQRVTKVIGVLRQIEERVGRMADSLGVKDEHSGEESAEERRRREQILNGPAVDGPEMGQDAIDALFD